ncbi:FAD-dependent oxidoreductase [Paracoccaceae bacterium]|jgi:3-phenylpropionate/trans-cinnamate dioxygenase ferredoxin reductase subunit|nr:FAD-dependent oxidoreductase [Paracoccaceae bacterium]
MTTTIVIGAGQAGAEVASKLRDEGYDDRILLIGQENYLPYQRPPLSKKYMAGEMALERLFLRPQEFYQDKNIELNIGKSAYQIDPNKQKVEFNGGSLHYDHLVLATGSKPRELPDYIGLKIKNLFTMRDLTDANSIEPFIKSGMRLLIVGGGYIGLEAAATARKFGVDVTLVEIEERILKRVAAKETSDYIRSLHISKGVKIKEEIGLDRLKIVGDKALSASLTDGSDISVDFVIVGIGIIPNTELAKSAKLKINNGIFVNDECRTSISNIYAAGDCTSFEYKNTLVRLESVGNAIDQANTVAQNILQQNTKYIPKPWFWSDQYNLKLQIAGLNTGYDDVVVRKGENDQVSHWYFKGPNLLAVDALNDPRCYMIGKRLIEANNSPTKNQLKDKDFNLKVLLK